MPRIIAKVYRQVRVNGKEVDVDPETAVSLDVTEEVLKLQKEWGWRMTYYFLQDDKGDVERLVRDAAASPKEIAEWQGSLRVEVDKSIRAYHESLEEWRKELDSAIDFEKFDWIWSIVLERVDFFKSKFALDSEEYSEYEYNKLMFAAALQSLASELKSTLPEYALEQFNVLVEES